MFDVAVIREQFPALQHTVNGRIPIFLDGPGGTQVPRRVIDAVVCYLENCNANRGGLFRTSRESDRILDEAHVAVADLLHAAAPEEVVFGQNMTTLTLHLSRSIGRTLRPGDVVLVTRLDHDANIRPWVLAARDAGAEARFIDIHPDDCTLDLDDLRRQLEAPRVRLLALTCASNAVGTVNDVKALTRLAHAAGAKVFLDAVHYAPHGPIDVQDWDCDFLACSVYKFFGPHVGVLWGRRQLLEELPAYKVKPAAEALPGRWMTGTQNHEGLAGVTAAIEYLAGLGTGSTRRQRLLTALTAVRRYEAELTGRLLEGLLARPRFKVWGITQRDRLGWRVPTVSLTCADRTGDELAESLGRHEIFTWNGNLYALELSERLGLEKGGGFLRLGLVHYNTPAEIDRLLQVLDAI